MQEAVRTEQGKLCHQVSRSGTETSPTIQVAPRGGKTFLHRFRQPVFVEFLDVRHHGGHALVVEVEGTGNIIGDAEKCLWIDRS